MLAAVASYLAARASDGRWLLRIEDIDPPREQPGAADEIIRALERYGFEWDGPVLYQSASTELHAAARERLLAAGEAYRCDCSRRDLADCPQGPLGTIYPGTCRSGCDADEYAIRLLTTDLPIEFRDGLQGRQTQRLQSESGDFVIWRRDELVAYHLAVVVDDFEQGVTEIVRGIDLLDSTPRQIWLQQRLGYPTPDYRHIPVVTLADGSKLSKSTGAEAVPLDAPGPVLAAALRALRQAVPQELARNSVQEIWSWAEQNWRDDALAGMTAITDDCNAISRPENGLL
jgi:glutamyl-Q tRNA(Asp) synthetase